MFRSIYIVSIKFYGPYSLIVSSSMKHSTTVLGLAVVRKNTNTSFVSQPWTWNLKFVFCAHVMVGFIGVPETIFVDLEKSSLVNMSRTLRRPGVVVRVK